MRSVYRPGLAALVIAIGVTIASARSYAFDPQPEPPLVAQASKIKAAGKLIACQANAAAKSVIRGFDPQPEPPKCTEKFVNAFGKAEAKCVASGATCVQGDAPAIAAIVATTSDHVNALLSQDLAGALHYVDNDDGTVSDLRTGLTWEKKTGVTGSAAPCIGLSSCPDVHDLNHLYRWSANITVATGEVFANFLGHLNGAYDGVCLGGHCDWRLPTMAELRTIFDTTRGNCGGGSGPCIDPLLGPSASSGYWSSETLSPPNSDTALLHSFGGPVAEFGNTKTSHGYARGVRGIPLPQGE